MMQKIDWAIPLMLASIFISLLSVPLLFLGVTIFILPPFAFYLALKAYRTLSGTLPARYWPVRILIATPMLVALAAFFFELHIITTGYRA
jgi:hypothetical protein